MNGYLLVITLALGLAVAAALPTKNLQTVRTRRNSAASSGGLGIYDGKTTTIDQHNYLVSLVVNEGCYCAGAIVSASYVITLGDCINELSASDITVVTGSSDGTTGTAYSVKTIIKHPSYGDSIASYDFALLKIKGTFTWGDDVGNVTLPSADPKGGAALVVAGWGNTSALRSSGGSTLYQGTMKYVTETNCETYYSDSGVTFDSSMACAYNKGKTTMCSGDFGDPFVQGTTLYGLMAGGASSGFCTDNALPVIIADVYTVVTWINKYI